jgi:hypothetical protein
MLVLKPTSPHNIVHLASVIVHFVIELATNQKFSGTPFYNFAFSTSDISESYLPGEPYSEGEMVTQAWANNDMQLLFKCLCGCIHLNIHMFIHTCYSSLTYTKMFMSTVWHPLHSSYGYNC